MWLTVSGVSAHGCLICGLGYNTQHHSKQDTVAMEGGKEGRRKKERVWEWCLLPAEDHLFTHMSLSQIVQRSFTALTSFLSLFTLSLPPLSAIISSCFVFSRMCIHRNLLLDFKDFYCVHVWVGAHAPQVPVCTCM